jgi:CheY-like chemotaxis protein
MPETPARLLVVDDEPSIRTSMSHVLAEIGYRVRVAEDGFAALLELRKEIPDILVCDLNMPGMSGFELLSVVRRRFPMIRTIAMSGAFCGDEAPSGVAADAFYQKGSSLVEDHGIPARAGTNTDYPASRAVHHLDSVQRTRHFRIDVCEHCLSGMPAHLSAAAGWISGPGTGNELHGVRQFDSLCDSRARQPYSGTDSPKYSR